MQQTFLDAYYRKHRTKEKQSCGFRSDQVAHASQLSMDLYPDPKAKLPAEGVGSPTKKELKQEAQNNYWRQVNKVANRKLLKQLALKILDI